MEDLKIKAQAYLTEPGLLDRIADDIHRLGVAGETDLALTLYLVGTSRLLTKPLAALVTGVSSSGKSYVIRQVATLFPEEAVFLAHQISPKALFHVEDNALKHKFVVAGERSRQVDDKAADATRALREMISDGYLTGLCARLCSDPSKDWKTDHGRVEGPIAHVESTTLPLSQVFPEDRTRFLILDTDESEEQSRAIVRVLAEKAKNPDPPASMMEIKELHHAAQRLLEQVDVAVPFADRLPDYLPTNRTEIRRAFPQLLGVVQASALLHQFQRAKDGKGRVLATLADYRIAKRLLARPFQRMLGLGVSQPARQVLDKLKSKATENQYGFVAFTTKDLADWGFCKRRSVQSYVGQLLDAGLITQQTPAHGSEPAKYVVGKTPLPECDTVPELPDFAEVA